ncbi:hypothetical protein GCM10010195_73930 [Kitasatospora griseola]|nr:hypothetical protein GCM10010195_73930 [Kitasatospora griseola]
MRPSALGTGAGRWHPAGVGPAGHRGGEVMGEHEKPTPDPGTGTPPPGNADGKVDKPQPGTGKHKK